MRVTIEVIPHSKQRYETIGDWVFSSPQSLQIRVSKLKDPRYSMLVAVHELIEALLCRHRDIDEQAITDFDIAFEELRAPGNTDEPGDDQNAPYRKEHFFATSVERLLAAELGVNWKEYEDAIYEL